MDKRLSEQMGFILEIDRLKRILRQTLISDAGRRENSAEHSWHLAMMAMVLVEYANEPVDVGRVIQMLLVHDLVEIDAGDTYCYDEKGMADKAEREECAARRIFGLLPEEQGRWLRALWDEFEANQTSDANFANALDRLQPMLLNFHTEGISWKEHQVRLEQVLGRNRVIEKGSKGLWEYARRVIDEAVERRYIRG